MAELLYFVETKGPRNGLSAMELAAMGSVLPRGCGQMGISQQDAPRKRAGVLLWASQATELAARHVCDHARMEWGPWGKLPTGEEVLVGKWRDWVPGPQDLERPGMLGGMGVRLEDGNLWTIPRLMYRTGGSALPGAIGIVNGEIVEKPMARYVQLQRTALECHGIGRSIATGEAFDARRVVELAVEALGINYRLTGAEVMALELLTAERAVAVMCALVDVDVDGEKKNGPRSAT